MPELSHIDPRSAALLVMDYQVDTLTKFMTAAQSADAIACVPDLIAMAREGNRSWSSPHQPVRWHRPGDAAARQRRRHAGARRCPHQRRRAVDRSPRRRSGLSVGRRPRLLRRPRCRGACDAARHRHREAGGRCHHGARRRPAWQVFMNERAPACLHQAMTYTQRHRVGDVLNNGLP